MLFSKFSPLITAGSLASDDGKILQEPSPDKSANAKTPKERKRKRKTPDDPANNEPKPSRKPSDNNRTINDYFGKPQSSPGRLHSGAKSPSPSAAQFLPCSPQPPPFMGGDFIRMQPPPAPRAPTTIATGPGSGVLPSSHLQQQQQQQQPQQPAAVSLVSSGGGGGGGLNLSGRPGGGTPASRAVQTDLTLDRLDEIETRSSAEMEVQSAKIDELTRRLTSSQKSIDTQKETINRCLSVVKVSKSRTVYVTMDYVLLETELPTLG